MLYEIQRKESDAGGFHQKAKEKETYILLKRKKKHSKETYFKESKRARKWLRKISLAKVANHQQRRLGLECGSFEVFNLDSIFPRIAVLEN
jgi:hypothetical protein